MRKMTRLILISVIFVTSGLTAKIATENYKAATPNNERIHTAYELAKKPNKAAVLEAIVDATNAESDERIQNAVVIDPDEPKVVRVKTKVTTSAGVSPIASVMDKKAVNKAEEFIENIAHPAEVVTKKNLDSTTEDIPIQELVYEMKDIFPTFEEVVVVLPNTYDYPYRMTWPEGAFGNTMTILGYKTYYTVNYQGEDLEIWYDEDTGRWGSDNAGYRVSVWGNKVRLNGDEVTLSLPTRQVPTNGHDGVFSYTYDADNKVWERWASYQVFPAGIDIDKLNIDTTNKSTWLIMEVENCYNGATHATLQRIYDNSLAMGADTFPQNVYKKVGFLSLDREGNSTVGYWAHSEYVAKPIHNSLQAGNKFMTLDEYNETKGTNYRWE